MTERTEDEEAQDVRPGTASELTLTARERGAQDQTSQGTAQTAPSLELKHVALVHALREEATYLDREAREIEGDPEILQESDAATEGERLRDQSDELREKAKSLLSHIRENASELLEGWRSLPREDAKALNGWTFDIPSDVAEEHGWYDAHQELERLGLDATSSRGREGTATRGEEVLTRESARSIPPEMLPRVPPEQGFGLAATGYFDDHIPHQGEEQQLREKCPPLSIAKCEEIAREAAAEMAERAKVGPNYRNGYPSTKEDRVRARLEGRWIAAWTKELPAVRSKAVEIEKRLEKMLENLRQRREQHRYEEPKKPGAISILFGGGPRYEASANAWRKERKALDDRERQLAKRVGEVHRYTLEPSKTGWYPTPGERVAKARAARREPELKRQVWEAHLSHPGREYIRDPEKESEPAEVKERRRDQLEEQRALEAGLDVDEGRG